MYVYSHKGKRNLGFTAFPHQSLSRTNTHTVITLPGELAMVCVHATSTSGQIQPHARLHCGIIFIFMNLNVDKISSHLFQLPLTRLKCITQFRFFNNFVPSTVTLAERVHSNLSYTPQMTQKIQETMAKFREYNKSGVAYFGCSTTRKAETVQSGMAPCNA